MKEILVLLLYIAVVYPYPEETAPITEEQRAEGYACNSQYVDLMKEGEVRTNYRPYMCGGVRCRRGNIEIIRCGFFAKRYCSDVLHDYSKPYPYCCRLDTCVP